MAKTKYNHKRRIKDLQPGKAKFLKPGTIIQFKYVGENVFDNLPIVLVLWNNIYGNKIHGINMNYLTENKIKVLFGEIIERGNDLVVEDQDDESDYDDTLPYRNLLKDPYTRLKLPTYKEIRGGNPLSKAEAVKQMNMLYEKKLKKVVKKEDIYRSYLRKKMSGIKVVRYDIEGLIK